MKKGLNTVNNLMRSLKLDRGKEDYGVIEEVKRFNNGEIYGVIKKGSHYYIRKALVEQPKYTSDFGFIENKIEESKHYKKKSLMSAIKSLNYLEEHINEKYVLKVDKPKDKDVDLDIDLDSEVSSGVEDLKSDNFGNDSKSGEDNGGDEESNYEDFEEDEDEADLKSYIQKLSGKLAYKIGEYNEDDYSDTAKYAVNMLLSRIDPNKLEDNDKADIINKVETEMSEGDDESSDPIQNDEQPVKEIYESKTYSKREFLKSLLIESMESLNRQLDEVDKDFLDDEDEIKKWADGIALKYNEGLLNTSIENIIGEFLNINGVEVDEDIVSSIESQIEIFDEQGGLTGNSIMKIVSKYMDLKTEDENINEFLDVEDLEQKDEQPEVYLKHKKVIDDILSNNLEKYKAYFNKVMKHFDIDVSKLKNLKPFQGIALLIMGSISSDESDDLYDFLAEKNDFEVKDLADAIYTLEEVEELGLSNSDEDKLLYDLEEIIDKEDNNGEDDLLFDLDEEVFSEKPKKVKNKKFKQTYFGVDIGRYEGDDDAVIDTPNLEFNVDGIGENKINPFDY